MGVVQNIAQFQRVVEPNYVLQAVKGTTFFAANQAVATTTIGLATTYTGLVLSNPIASTSNLILLKGSWMQSVIQATQVEGFAIATGYNAGSNVTHTTPATINTTLIGNPNSVTSVAKVDTSATLPTAPVYTWFVGNTATATQNNPGGIVDFQGSIVLPPGGYALWVTPTQASVAGMWFSFTWEEAPTTAI